jgi:hypothetical protein
VSQSHESEIRRHSDLGSLGAMIHRLTFRLSRKRKTGRTRKSFSSMEDVSDRERQLFFTGRWKKRSWLSLFWSQKTLLAWDSRITTEASEGRSFNGTESRRPGFMLVQRNSPRSDFCVVKHEDLRNRKRGPNLVSSVEATSFDDAPETTKCKYTQLRIG